MIKLLLTNWEGAKGNIYLLVPCTDMAVLFMFHLASPPEGGLQGFTVLHYSIKFTTECFGKMIFLVQYFDIWIQTSTLGFHVKIHEISCQLELLQSFDVSNY